MTKTKTQNTAIYVRVSTTDQTCANQTRDLRAYCERREMRIVDVYADDGVSGAVVDRPALSKMMQDARKGKIDHVLVWKLDRLGRSTIHLLETLRELTEMGVTFGSYSEGIDTASSVGKMVTTFLAAVAEFERDLIRERTLAGMRRAQASGVHCGRPRKHFDVATAIRLQRQGLGLRRIAKQLGVSHTTVYRGILAVSKASSTNPPQDGTKGH